MVIDLIKILVKIKEVPARDIVIEKYFQLNPDIIVYLRALSIGIMIGTLVEDVFTAGAGTMDDEACFAMAMRLWKFSEF